MKILVIEVDEQIDGNASTKYCLTSWYLCFCINRLCFLNSVYESAFYAAARNFLHVIASFYHNEWLSLNSYHHLMLPVFGAVAD